jgi:hypothetical protein
VSWPLGRAPVTAQAPSRSAEALICHPSAHACGPAYATQGGPGRTARQRAQDRRAFTSVQEAAACHRGCARLRASSGRGKRAHRGYLRAIRLRARAEATSRTCCRPSAARRHPDSKPTGSAGEPKAFFVCKYFWREWTDNRWTCFQSDEPSSVCRKAFVVHPTRFVFGVQRGGKNDRTVNLPPSQFGTAKSGGI